jgi:hypothetical protein
MTKKSKMNKPPQREPVVCMRPEDLPLQRLHAVVDLPPRPASFRGHCQWHEPIPAKDAPRGNPRNVEYLGNVEWAWGFRHDRLDAYYLNPRGKYWLLWISSLDPNAWTMEWRWVLYAWGLKRGVSDKQAAIYLLADAWASEARESGLGQFEWINEAGTLSVPELCATARLAWSWFEIDEEE